MSKATGNLDKIVESLQIRTTRDASGTTDLRYAVLPPKAAAKRWLVLLNGRSEWIEKYAYVAADLGLPQDCGFLTMDHRGQGASGGARAYVDSYDSYSRDVAKVINEATGGAPYAIMAHSMGGLIALYGNLVHQLTPKAMVLCSPLLGLPERPIPSPIARPLSKALTVLGLGPVSSGSGDFTANDFANNRLTHDRDRYERMKKCPYPIPGATFGWVAATFKATDYVFDPAVQSQMTAPTLVIGGTAEAVVNGGEFRRFTDLASKHAKVPVSLRLIPGAKHELLSEIPEYYEPTLTAARAFLADFFN